MLYCTEGMVSVIMSYEKVLQKVSENIMIILFDCWLPIRDWQFEITIQHFRVRLYE